MIYTAKLNTPFANFYVLVPFYQPEAAFRVFNRALSNLDIATGKIDITTNTTYGTTGPSTIDDITNVDPGFPEPTCYVLEPYTCDEESWSQVTSSKGLIKNYILQKDTSTGSNSTTPNGTVGVLPVPSPSHSLATRSAVEWTVCALVGAVAFMIQYM